MVDSQATAGLQAIQDLRDVPASRDPGEQLSGLAHPFAMADLRDPVWVERLAHCIRDSGFLTVATEPHNSGLRIDQVSVAVLEAGIVIADVVLG